MSMAGYFQQITAEQLERFKQHPEEVAKSIDDNSAIAEPLYIDKTWHGLHFLLTGDANGGEPPLSHLMMSENLIDYEMELGSPAYLEPQEVEEVLEALSTVTRDELEARYDPELMQEEDVYPGPWDPENATEDVNYLLSYYDAIVEYLEEAVESGNAILFYLK